MVGTREGQAAVSCSRKGIGYYLPSFPLRLVLSGGNKFGFRSNHSRFFLFSKGDTMAPNGSPEHHKVIVLGAGINGLALAKTYLDIDPRLTS